MGASDHGLCCGQAPGFCPEGKETLEVLYDACSFFPSFLFVLCVVHIMYLHPIHFPSLRPFVPAFKKDLKEAG